MLWRRIPGNWDLTSVLATAVVFALLVLGVVLNNG